MTHEQQTFREHLQELSKRLRIPAALFAVGMLAGFIWYKPFSHLLTKPLGETLYFTSPTGGLNYMMFISLVLGLAVALPAAVYQLVQFIRPVHRKITTRSAVMIMLASLGMAALGIVYAYLISLPSALQFLLDLGGSDVRALITTNEYISFLSAYLLGTAAIFQLPVILFFIDHIRPIPPGTLKKAQKPIIAASFIIGAMITPTPDPYNQLMITGPMLILFEGSVALIYLQRLRRQRRPHASRTVEAPRPKPAISQPLAPARESARQPFVATQLDSRAFMPVADLAPATLSQPKRGFTRSELSSPQAKTAQDHVIDLSTARVTHVVRRGPKRRYQLPTATRPIIDIHSPGTA